MELCYRSGIILKSLAVSHSRSLKVRKIFISYIYFFVKSSWVISKLCFEFYKIQSMAMGLATQWYKFLCLGLLSYNLFATTEFIFYISRLTRNKETWVRVPLSRGISLIFFFPKSMSKVNNESLGDTELSRCIFIFKAKVKICIFW